MTPILPQSIDLVFVVVWTACLAVQWYKMELKFLRGYSGTDLFWFKRSTKINMSSMIDFFVVQPLFSESAISLYCALVNYLNLETLSWHLESTCHLKMSIKSFHQPGFSAIFWKTVRMLLLCFCYCSQKYTVALSFFQQHIIDFVFPALLKKHVKEKLRQPPMTMRS